MARGLRKLNFHHYVDAGRIRHHEIQQSVTTHGLYSRDFFYGQKADLPVGEEFLQPFHSRVCKLPGVMGVCAGGLKKKAALWICGALLTVL